MTHPDGTHDKLVRTSARLLRRLDLPPSMILTIVTKLKQRGVIDAEWLTLGAALYLITALLDGTKTET